MIRTPELSNELLMQYRKYDGDIFAFLDKDFELNQFIKKALLVSSKSLYESYINLPLDQKKRSEIKRSLLKFFIRSTTRPTPYGLFSSVSLGRFSNETNLLKSDSFYEIDLDCDYADKISTLLEKDSSIRGKATILKNDLIYGSRDVLKNPYLSGEKNTEETQINITPLWNLVNEIIENGVCYDELIMEIMKHYDGISKEKVTSTIDSLIENEFLYTNLRFPAYCNNRLDYLISELELMNYTGEYFTILSNFRTLIEIYKNKSDISILEDLLNEMKKIAPCENYLLVNTGSKYDTYNLNIEIKEKVEQFTNYMVRFPLKYTENSKLKNAFIETFGQNVEVPLEQIIDKSSFDFNRHLRSENNSLGDNAQLKTYLNSKISLAIINQREEVRIDYIELEDFLVKESSGIENSFDLNFFITQKDDKVNLTLSPNLGSSQGKAGAMFQRFSNCFPTKIYREYNEIYERIKWLSEEDYIIVEARENIKNGRGNNVVNKTNNFDYFICFGNYDLCFKDQIEIDDIVVGNSVTDQLYLKSKKYNKKIKVVLDNMLNPMNCNPILQLLLEISSAYEISPVENFAQLFFGETHTYTPRILIGDVIVTPRKWNLTKVDIFGLNTTHSFSSFKENIQDKALSYKIPKMVYLVEADNRIILDLTSEVDKQIVFRELEKKGRVEFQEVEPSFFENELVLDRMGRKYTPEFTFSCLLDSKQSIINNKLIDKSSTLIVDQKNKTLFEDGWIYAKIYGLGDRTNDFLSNELRDFLLLINQPKHFFIRYVDNDGDHLRLRFKFSSEKDAVENFVIINQWLKELFNKREINHFSYDIYSREINRYGGRNTIEQCEQVFFSDSIYIESQINKLISNSDENDKEKLFIKGISIIIYGITENLDEALILLDSRYYDNKHRKEYKKKSRFYMNIVSSIFEKNSDFSFESEALINDLKKLKLELSNPKGKYTCSKEDLLFSLIHMHCNRLNGDRNLEEKFLEFVRNAVFQLVQRNKFEVKV